MMPLTVIESKVAIQIPDSIWNVDIVFQIDLLILHAPPQTLVVTPTNVRILSQK